jgi:hypothetical protein
MGLVRTKDVSTVEADCDQDMSTHLTRVIQAKCANCRTRETAAPDILKRAVELFSQRGWRVRDTKLLCKECVKLW